MNIIYLQCDTRYNQWMLEKIDKSSVIEHTIRRCKAIGLENGGVRIISGIYDCPENQALLPILKEQGVKIYLTKEDNVNRRFLSIVTRNENAENEYVIRVGGDQCLLDSDRIADIVREMSELSMDWFFERYVSCILPDIISLRCLKKYEEELLRAPRYFCVLENKMNIRRYALKSQNGISFNFRANSNEGLRICRYVIMYRLNPYELSWRVQGELAANRYLQETGIMGSWILPPEFEEFYYDEKREINPWWTASAIHIIKNRLNKSMRVFEWGAGNSTLFYGKRVEEVVSIEHDLKWYTKMRETVGANVEIRYIALEYGGEYCNAIMQEKRFFDIISIDGRDRVRCAKYAVSRIKDSGVIIWDDAEREEYQEGYDYLQQLGFKKLELTGLTYGYPAIEKCTAIFYKEGNVLGI